jgi:hypothetical protein
VAGETRRKEKNVQTTPPPPKDLIYVKNKIERLTKAMTQSDDDCRVAELIREEVAVGEEIDDWLELEPESDRNDDDEGLIDIEG